jgi:hypothetical protein
VAQGSATAFFARRLPQKGTEHTARLSSPQEQFGGPERMAATSNGVTSNNGSTAKPDSSSPRCPRRVVLLRAGEDSEVESVLIEYYGAEVSGKRLHADLQRLAEEHRGRLVAAEWFGSLGWTRFLWGRRGEERA